MRKTTLLLLSLLCTPAFAEDITCGLKTITVEDGKITRMKHEDGTVHAGDIERNWNYDGKSIDHKLFGDPIPCGTKPKTRDEVIDELSSTFTQDPGLHGMTSEEGALMRAYTANMMRTQNQCHLLSVASKSTSRKGMFFIDCNTKSGKSRRTWVSGVELRAGVAKTEMRPVSDTVAIEICNKELKARATNPSSYDPSLILDTSARKVESNGRNVVEIGFEASNAFGLEGEFRGRCILEGGRPIEVTITQ